MNEKSNKIKLAILSFSCNFVIGSLAMITGATLADLALEYNTDLSQIVLIGSAYSAGRVLISLCLGKIIDRIGVTKMLGISLLVMCLYLGLLPNCNNIVAGCIASFIGGVGFGGADASVPVILSAAFRENISSAFSAGQVLYGCGGFAVSYLAVLMLQLNLSYKFIYYLFILIICFIIVGLIILTKKGIIQPYQEDNTVRPLYTKNKLLATLVVFIASFAYCIIANLAGTYIIPFGQGVGMNEVEAGYLLTVYNVGSVIGAIVFTPVLAKVNEKKVFLINTIVSVIALSNAFVINSKIGYFIALAVVGGFHGVLYSTILTIATRVDYKRPGYAAALVGTGGGVGDILAPIASSLLVKSLGIVSTFKSLIIVFSVQLLAAVFLNFLTHNHKPKNVEE